MYLFTALTVRRGLCYLYIVIRWDLMADTTALYALRFPDGSVSLYIDELYAQDRGIDPSQLVRVEIPREMFLSGSIQDIREYVALQLEQREQRTGTA